MGVLTRTIAIAIVVLGGCYDPGGTPGRCVIACSPSHACPGDLACRSDNFCHPRGDETECGLNEVVQRDLLAAAGDHVCAIDNDGGLACWGANFNGQLGADPADVQRQATPLPVVVPGVSQWVSVAASPSSTCAIDNDGRLFCWGDHRQGQLGIGGSLDAARAPEQVDGGSGTWLTVAMGLNHTCAILRGDQSNHPGGDLYCWGGGVTSISGIDPLPIRVTLPVVVDHDDWLEVTIGASFAVGDRESYTCLRRADGLYCWGDGAVIEALGTMDRDTVVPVLQPRLFQRVRAGANHVCAVEVDRGDVWCWGHDDAGQLGRGSNDTTMMAFGPGLVTTAPFNGTWADVAVGDGHTCTRSDAGKIVCVGAASVGQTGHREPLTLAGFEVLPTGTDATAFAAGAAFNCSRASDGSVSCWGSNRHGQLGRGMFGDMIDPTEIAVPGGGGTWIAVAAGDHTTCGVSNSRTMYCWGLADDGIVATDSPTPTPFAPELSFASVDVRSTHACGIAVPAGTSAVATIDAYCWGRNDHAQLGPNAAGMMSSSMPILVPLEVPSDIAVGDGWSCAIERGFAQTISCWGKASTGALGPGQTTDSAAKTDLVILKPQTVVAGRDHVCATHEPDVNGNVNVTCWGNNDDFKVSPSEGPGLRGPTKLTGASSMIPLAVDTELGLGSTTTCVEATPSVPVAIKVVVCWGRGDRGQLGAGSKLATAAGETVSVVGNWKLGLGVGAAGACSSTAGAMQCWGTSDMYLNGLTPPLDATPPQPKGPDNTTFVPIRVGARHGCGITSGHLFCWGNNDALQLGIGLGFDAAPATVVVP